jgi:hypothetical protein
MRLAIIVFCFAVSLARVTGQTYGLQFSGHEVPLNERTELYLTPEKPLSFENELDLTFELRFQPNSISYFGYVFRMVIGSQTIDFIHGFLPDNPNNFQLVFNDRPSSISFSRPIETLTTEWMKLRFSVDLNKGVISCNQNDIVLTDQIQGFDAREGVRIFFGAHEYRSLTTTDVFQMSVRNIELKTDNKHYSWPLKQAEDDVVLEVNHHKNGWVKNPNWLLTLHTNWKKLAGLELSGLAQTAFDQEEDLIYIATSEALYVVDLTDISIKNEDYASPFKILSSNNLLYDSTKNRLVSYSIDHNYKSEYDPQSRSWSLIPKDTSTLTHYWHHNSFLHPDGDIYTFGGYGNFKYQNLVLQFPPAATGFDTLIYEGAFFPRYLAAVGYSEKNNKLYILGGYGSKSGQQTLSPSYYYELIEYSFKERRFSKVFDFSETEKDFCFANSAIIEDNQLYALSFSKYHFENSLQLIHLDLDSPEIENLGSPIEFNFIDVNSNVELYFSKVSSKLIAVTSYMRGEKTELDIFSISFPPQKFDDIEALVKKREGTGTWMVVLLIFSIIVLLSGLIIWYFLSNRKSKNISELQDVAEILPDSSKFIIKKKDPVKSSIILFGGFQVIDSEGNDITGSFTQLLKNLLLFIMLNSLRHNKGVSSQVISETFWFDKSVESARNNRAVNIVKIKTLLEKVGKATISKDTGYWKFEYDPQTMEIDYANYLEIVKSDAELNRDDVCELLKIVDRGQFLVNTDTDWLDVYKSEVSNNIIDKLADYIEISENEPDFVLHLTNCMFTFDMASEEAMILQCRTLFKLGKHSLAKKSYGRFVKEYKNLYDEEYARSFSSIIEAGEGDKK